MEANREINLLDVFLKVLQESSLQDSLEFYQTNRHFARWLILSDYCQTTDKKTHETYCFSIAPVFFDLQEMKSAIGYFQPTDLKGTRFISDDFLEIAASDKFLHFVFSFGNAKQNPFRRSSVQNTRETIRDLLHYADQIEYINRGNQDFASMRKRLHLAEQESKKAAFNYPLFDKMVVISGIGAALAGLVSKHTNAQDINWMSDRDNIMTYCDGLVCDLFSISFMGTTYRLNISQKCRLWTSHDEGNGKMWFDELIRIPDFVAGAFSRISLSTGSIALSKQSYVVQKTLRRVHFFTLKEDADGLVFQRQKLKT